MHTLNNLKKDNLDDIIISYKFDGPSESTGTGSSNIYDEYEKKFQEEMKIEIRGCWKKMKCITSIPNSMKDSEICFWRYSSISRAYGKLRPLYFKNANNGLFCAC